MSNERKQTALEWLAKQMLWDEFHNPYFEQAKEMEKEQIEEAFTKGNRLDVYDGTETSGEQYYNETYGGKK